MAFKPPSVRGVVGQILDNVSEQFLPAHHFYLEIEGVWHGPRAVVAGFKTVSGGGMKIEKRDVTHGDDMYKVHQPGIIEYENLVLEKGMTHDVQLLEWIQAVAAGEHDRRSGAVIVVSDGWADVRLFSFHEAYPISWSGIDFSADSSNILVEKVELAVGHIRVDDAVSLVTSLLTS